MKSRRRAQSIVETVVGITFLVPIALFLFDVATLVTVEISNDNLAKSMARAAGSAVDTGLGTGTAAAGFNAANNTARSFGTSSIIKHPNGGSFLTGYSWNAYGSANSAGSTWPSELPTPTLGSVGVVTTMKVNLPIPFPFLPKSIELKSKCIDSIVSVAAGQTDPLGGGDVDPDLHRRP